MAVECCYGDNLQPDYTLTGDVYQLVIPMDIGEMIPADDSVRLLNSVQLIDKVQTSAIGVNRIVQWSPFWDELESSRQASVVSLQACMSFFWVLISVIVYAWWPKDTL